jgi:predicted DCC family thiol-disulfide oxidoreductase YuxK
MIQHPVIFYDGHCALCNGAVKFFIKYDKQKKYRYAALQSALAQNLLNEQADMKSFVLYVNGKVFRQSDAALKALAGLGGLWKLCLIFWPVPRFIRNGIYNWIARNRYRWFGQYETCPLPQPHQKHLFLDQA